MTQRGSEGRWGRLKRWLRPGMGIKRWLLMMFVGLTILATAGALFIRILFREVPADSLGTPSQPVVLQAARPDGSLATLEIFARDNIVAHAKRLGDIATATMSEWESYRIVRQARGNGLLLGVSFGKPESAGEDEKDWWTARAVRGKMLENGVWAICDREDTIRMYPALNMDESVLREGLEVMEDAILHVEKRGHTEGDAAAYPSGVAGF